MSRHPTIFLGASLLRRTTVLVGASLLLGTFVLAGCGLNLEETPPPSGPLPTALASLPAAIAAARSAVESALRSEAQVGLDDAPEGYRPAEPPTLIYVPRGVFKVGLPNDPNRLYVVVYDFRDEAAATDAGRLAAAFYASGPALVQFPSDSQFALRQVGQTLVFCAWSPGSTSDQATARAAFEAIGGVGQAVPGSP